MKVPIKDIDWQKMVNDERKLTSKSTKKPLSAKTIKAAWSFIASVLQYNKSTPPELSLPQVIALEKPWIEPEQIPTFLEAIRGDEYETHILLALHGLRRSEILAVNNSRIKCGVIKVMGAKVRYKNNNLVYKEENKNTSSRRDVDIVIPRLKELLKEPIAEIPPNALYKRINKLCQKAGLPPVGVHGLRRSFASLCYHLKLSERETIELGGWSDSSTMRNFYIKLAKKDKEQATSKLKLFYAEP